MGWAFNPISGLLQVAVLRHSVLLPEEPERERERDMEEDALYLHLHKLSSLKSEEELEDILLTLWKTRKTGLPSPAKSHLQSLLNLPSINEVDPVLACLRSLVRRFTHENLTGGDLLKLFPPDLSLDLQSILILLFQKHQNQWKEDVSRDQVRTSVPSPFTALPSSRISQSLWPRQDDPNGCNDFDGSAPIIADSSVPFLALRDADPHDNLGMLPRLKSMTWTMENRNSVPANRVAVINLKLQDCTKSTQGEMEVKFRLTRETLEAMLRSMTYISEQLSKVGTSSSPAQKKQRQ